MEIIVSDAIELINSQNLALASHMELAQTQINNITVSTCAASQLNSDSYREIDSRIQMRPLILSTHFAAFEAISSANTANSALLSALPTSLVRPGVVSDTECIEYIMHWNREKIRLQNEYSNLLDTLSSVQTGSDYNPTGTYLYYACSIENAGKMVQKWTDIQRDLYEYNSASATLYTNAQHAVGTVLGASTDAVTHCIDTGDYSPEALKGLTDCLNEYRLKYAEENLTPEQYAALEKALQDGVITADEIYSAAIFNEDLYSALMALPSGLVLGSDIQAIAGAYMNMWIAMDVPHIERMIELSYVEVPGAESDLYTTYLDGTQTVAPVSLFALSPLMDSVSAVLLTSLQFGDFFGEALEGNDYLKVLAGTNLLQVLVEDGTQYWCAADVGVVADIDAIVSYGDTNKSIIDAIACGLKINPSHLETSALAKESVSDAGDGVLGNTFFCVSGQLGDVSSLLNGIVNRELNPTNFDFYGVAEDFILGLGLEVVGSEVPGVSLIANMINSVYDEWGRIALAFVNSNNNLCTLAGDSTHGGGLLQLGNFAFNMKIEINSQPADYLSFDTTWYLNNTERATLDVVINAYNEQLKDFYSLAPGGSGPPYSDSMALKYCTSEQFIQAMQDDIFYVISGIDNRSSTSTGPSIVSGGIWSPNASASLFVDWCGFDADLVYRDTGVDSGGSHSNYNYAINSDSTLENFCPRWEYERANTQ
ncbi:MAG: hypothetical protein FWE41_03460 [Coriobacteriia bacterium]|nr:hypothetical protein [Coriobacteriia bacterium]MCL2749717.1 hypothetical protein [Coriobacteriia bacterium]